MRKKLLSIVLTLAMVLWMVPAMGIAAFAEGEQTPTAQGNCGDNMTWKYYESTYTLAISGEGAMYDYSKSDSTTTAPWAIYADNIKTITVSEGVTHIGNYAFYNHKMTEVSLPDGLQSIGEGSFTTYYSTMKSFSLPDSVETVGANSFGISSLEDLYLGNVNTLKEGAQLKDLNVRDFDYLSNIENISVSESNTKYSSVDGMLLSKDGKTLIACPKGRTSITVPEGVTTIGTYACYSSSNVQNVTFNEGLKTIEDKAFGGCTHLTVIELPDSVETVGKEAFISCGTLKQPATSLDTLSIGAGLTSVGEGAFALVHPKNITIDEDNTCFEVRDGALIGPCKVGNDTYTAMLIYMPEAGETSYVVPEGVKFIDRSVFEGNENLNEIILPDGLVKLGVRVFINSKVKKIYVPTGVKSVGNFCFSDISLSDVYYAGDDWNTSCNGTSQLFSLGSAVLHTGHEHSLAADGDRFSCECGYYKDAVTVPSGISKTYTGKSIAGVAAGEGYNLAGTVKATNAGTYTVTAALKDDGRTVWADGTSEAKTITWTIKKATPTVKITSSTKTVKYSSVKKKATYTTVLAVSGAKGTKTFKKVSGSAKLTVTSAGKIKVKKGTRKGTYSIKVKVTSASTKNYNAKTSPTKTIKVKVK